MFQSVESTRREASPTSSEEKRRELPGGAAAYMYQRKASAPWASITSHGFTTLPRDLDIFWPSPSSISPTLITLRKATPSGTSSIACSSVAMACRV